MNGMNVIHATGLRPGQVAGLLALSRTAQTSDTSSPDPVDRVELSASARGPELQTSSPSRQAPNAPQARRHSPRTLSRLGAGLAAAVAAGTMFASPIAALASQVQVPMASQEPVAELVAPARQAPAADAIFRQGDQGDHIAEFQGQLGGLGYYRGARDGQFSPDLEAAVRSFQRDAGIQATGALGPQTRGALARAREIAPANARFAAHQEILARAIAAEARGEPYEAQVAVGATILNYARRHGRSLPSLIRSSYLASNYDGNRVYYTRPTSSIANWSQLYQAAGDALAGRSRVGTNRVHFIDNSIRPPAWVKPSSALRLGRMVFFDAR